MKPSLHLRFAWCY